RYLIASTLAIIACGILSYYQGVEGAALSTLTVDLILIPYVLKRSLELTGDTMGEFIRGIGHEIKSAVSTAKRMMRMQKKIAE
ncbi:MAG: hypothetical protein JWP37_1031, partial [Mucilaginibacter sp.]|nr:hypothetical protein [Mucilaginibacter sp.]